MKPQRNIILWKNVPNYNNARKTNIQQGLAHPRGDHCHDQLPVVVATGVSQWEEDAAEDTASFIKILTF